MPIGLLSAQGRDVQVKIENAVVRHYNLVGRSKTFDPRENHMFNAEILLAPRKSVVTVMIPIRVSSDRYDALDRLDHILMDEDVGHLDPNDISFLVVDDGSLPEWKAKIHQKCAVLGVSLLHIDTQDEIFSIGRCRNYCAMYSLSKYIFFQDVDLMPYYGFYRDLLSEIRSHGLEENVADFLMIPFIFLTEYGTRRFKEAPAAERRNTFIHKALLNDQETIEKVSTGTSANIYNREYYLSRGGNDMKFQGWGYEDLELNTRLIRAVRKFPLPRDWLIDTKNFSTVVEYRGWKAVYRLFGDLSFGKGIALFHAWHPVNDAADYRGMKDVNFALFQKRMREYVKSGKEPPVLPSVCEGKTLIFRKNAFTFSREIQPKLGIIVFKDDAEFATFSELVEFCQENCISRILFHNPYATEHMQEVYEWAQKANLPIVVAERGALDGSCFFDSGGFLADSTSYAPAHWDRALDETERTAVVARVETMKASEHALEVQGLRFTAADFRKQFQIGSDQKLLLVALQRPTDAATRFFMGALGGYDRFIALVRDVIAAAPVGWVVIFKKHPLEDVVPDLPGGVNAEETHIKDLLAICDAVLTFNSGVGVLALLWEKPVMVAGRAFYAHPRLNWQVDSLDDALICMREPPVPDPETRLRFLYYLIFKFYSFGRFTTRPVRMPDGSRMTATDRIDYDVIRGLGQHDSPYPTHSGYRYQWESFLFDRYRFAETVFWAEQRGAKQHSSTPDKARDDRKPPALQNVRHQSNSWGDLPLKTKFKRIARQPFTYYVKWLRQLYHSAFFDQSDRRR